jgi:hypothetical protein
VRRAVIDRRTSETQVRVRLKDRPVRCPYRDSLSRSRAGAGGAARRVRPEVRAEAISMSISNTPWRTWASRWARRSPARSDRGAASAAWGTFSCRWTRRWASPRSISAGAAQPSWTFRFVPDAWGTWKPS